MSRPPKPPDDWYAPVIRLMLEESIDFITAAAIHGQPLDPSEADKHLRRSTFKATLAAMSRDFYENKSSPSQHSKSMLIGKMLEASQKLIQNGKLKESADVLAQVAKIEGWVGPESSVTIFQELSGADLGKLREVFAAKQKQRVN